MLIRGLLVSVLALIGCSTKTEFFCDENTPCLPRYPDRPKCDFNGILPGSDGVGNTCVPDPDGRDASAGRDSAVSSIDASVGPDTAVSSIDASVAADSAVSSIDAGKPCTANAFLRCEAGVEVTCSSNGRVEIRRTCDNGLMCDGVETCDSATGCKDGTPPALDDAVGCTADACDETNGVTHTADNSACANASTCDGVEVCNPTAGCEPGTAVDCGADTVCSRNLCTDPAGSCSALPNDLAVTWTFSGASGSGTAQCGGSIRVDRIVLNCGVGNSTATYTCDLDGTGRVIAVVSQSSPSSVCLNGSGAPAASGSCSTLGNLSCCRP